MTKASWLLLCLPFFSGAAGAEPDSCAGFEGPALTQCRSNQQTLRQQQQLERQLQQQEERQNQLDQQQREVQQQLETLRHQNESLRQQLEREMTSQASRPVAAESKSQDAGRNADVRAWKADNPWFGTDYARTQFAVRYVSKLQQERPDLAGRELLDALSTKVSETFDGRR